MLNTSLVIFQELQQVKLIEEALDAVTVMLYITSNDKCGRDCPVTGPSWLRLAVASYVDLIKIESRFKDTEC
jgi:hypothetical protein